ncbi:YtcA family lipoprotein [Novosphingobium sp. FSW06-99]|uniref:YtcA family lipoprotein n=1 Tax=Novosphingobium sp. FSW06-99 TaxID=1739113 RepID=UPI0018D20B43|nr:YtcA family lipoprotein [Novosphingobium sp. FSW06-99]
MRRLSGGARIACRAIGMMMVAPLGGCSAGAAPTIGLFGAWFPVWLLCAVIGVLAACVARGVMVGSGLADAIPGQLAVCAACGLIVACLIWLVGFGH